MLHLCHCTSAPELAQTHTSVLSAIAILFLHISTSATLFPHLIISAPALLLLLLCNCYSHPQHFRPKDLLYLHLHSAHAPAAPLHMHLWTTFALAPLHLHLHLYLHQHLCTCYSAFALCPSLPHVCTCTFSSTPYACLQLLLSSLQH